MEPTKFYKLGLKWTLYKSQSSWDTILSTIYSQLVGVSSLIGGQSFLWYPPLTYIFFFFFLN